MAGTWGEKPLKKPKCSDNESHQAMATSGEQSDRKLKSVGASRDGSNPDLREDTPRDSEKVQESEGFDIDSLVGHVDESDQTMATWVEESDTESDREPVYLDELYPDSDEEDMEKYRKYAKQARESEGFDIDTDYGRHCIGGVVPLDLLDEDDFCLRQAKGCTEYAIAEINRKQDAAKLELEYILTVNAQAVAGFNYFITLKARNTATGESNIYQTEVYAGLQNVKEVTVFREKPQRQGEGKVPKESRGKVPSSGGEGSSSGG